MTVQAEARFQIEAGRLIRGIVRRQVESACWSLGLTCDVRESKGFLESLYLFTVAGDETAVRRLLSWRDSYMARLN